MSNAVFPVFVGLAWSVVRVPTFNTLAQRAVSGFERRVALMTYPLWTFRLTYDLLRADSVNAELQSIDDFFRSRQGQWDNFLFNETFTPDNIVASASPQQIGVGDGVTTTFQLSRVIKSSGFSEPVMNLNGVPVIYDNAGVVSAANYTVSNTGLITFNVAPSAGHIITWSGSYYFRCRFAMDTLELENFLFQLWQLKKVELIGSLGVKI